MAFTMRGKAIALTAALALMGATGALAQAPQQPGGARQDACAAPMNGGNGGCAKTPARKADQKAQPRKEKSSRKDDRRDDRRGERSDNRRSDGPRVGDSGRRGAPLQQAPNSRLPKPPEGQGYRVVDDHIVRVDDKTMKILAVVGIASDIFSK